MSEIKEEMIQLAEDINYTSTNGETINELTITDFIEEETINELVETDISENNETMIELATTNLIEKYEELGDQLIILGNQITELQDKLINLPTIKSKIVKWPHHAYDFKMDDRIKDTLKSAETIISPDFYIYENYPTQKNLEVLLIPELEEYLQKKFISSDEIAKRTYTKLPVADGKKAA